MMKSSFGMPPAAISGENLLTIRELRKLQQLQQPYEQTSSTSYTCRQANRSVTLHAVALAPQNVVHTNHSVTSHWQTYKTGTSTSAIRSYLMNRRAGLHCSTPPGNSKHSICS